MPSVSTVGDSFTPETPPDSIGKGPETHDLPLVGQAIWLNVRRYDSRGRYVCPEVRQVVVLELADMSEREGWTITEVARTPHVRRGRWRVKYWDAGKWKRCYAYLDHEDCCPLQVGHLDLKTQRCIKLVGRAYDQNFPPDMHELAAVCREIMKTPLTTEDRKSLALFAVPREWSDEDRIALA